jgi:hypothetical protein
MSEIMQTHTKKQNIPQVPFAIIQLFSIVEEARSPTIRYSTGECTGIVDRVGRRAWKVSGGRRLNFEMDYVSWVSCRNTTT